MALSSLARPQSLLGPLGIARPSRKSGRSQLSLVGTPTVARGILPAANAVTITAVSGINYLGAMTITGLDFGSVIGTVTVGGVAQTIGTWTNTGITIPSLNCTGLYFGVSTPLVVTTSSGQSGTYILSTGVLPQTGWGYVTLTSVNTTAAWRITSAPDLAIGDQVSWGSVIPSGTVTVNADGSFEASFGATGFYAFVVSGGTWGATALQTISTGVVVTTQPASQSVIAPAAASFSLAYSGSPTPSIQWQYSTNSGATWINISGANSTTYSTGSTATGISGYLYRAQISNIEATIYSNVVSLTVTTGNPILTTAVPNFAYTVNTGLKTIATLADWVNSPTSFAISPALPSTGAWAFNTTTGAITVDTTNAAELGPYVITATNTLGSTPSNGFYIAINPAAPSIKLVMTHH